jgi:membrane protease YdiL (CAAX protease family)
MKRPIAYALVAVIAAIAITTTMDANGLTTFSALPLAGLTAVFWALSRYSRSGVGLTIARGSDYFFAVAYPVIVLSAATFVAFAFGAAHPSALPANWILRVLIASIAGILAALLTEEGFFRGWLWASLAAGSLSPMRILVVTSAAFALWHLSYATLAAGYTLPPGQVAIFMLNAAAMGCVWGLLRLLSGSIVVASVSHSVWNAIAYMLFGEGPKTGILGITQTTVFGAEVGIVGLALNCAAALVLLALYRTRQLGIVR